MSDRPWISVEDKLPFYFEGKYFDNEEDFFKWVKEWQFLSLDQETAEVKTPSAQAERLLPIKGPLLLVSPDCETRASRAFSTHAISSNSNIFEGFFL